MNMMNIFFVWIFFFFVISFTTLINFFYIKKYFSQLSQLQKSYLNYFIWLLSTCVFVFLLWIYFFYYYNILIANRKILDFGISYVIDHILSLDNILIWFICFEYFNIPINLQNRILTYGVLGSFILRFFLIMLSYWFLLHWNWVIFLFSCILLFSGLEMLLIKTDNNITDNIFLIFMMKYFNVINSINSEKFFLYKKNILYITPLFLVLVLIELSDILFALDSVPVTLTFVKDPCIIITANIFSILALRSIYFIIFNILNKNFYIKSIISIIVMLISVKIMYENYIYILENNIYIFIAIVLFLFLTFNILKKYFFR
ncbi:Putative membrane-bound redox modulator Alx [Buchnera aphidicola (Pterocallis alni)]